MTRYIKSSLLFLAAASFISCRSYVEKVPIQGQRVLAYTEDYRLLMNNTEALDMGIGQVPMMSCDDVDLSSTALQDRIGANAIQLAMYTWKKPFYVGESEDYDWNKLYNNIYVYNTVINGVLDSRGGASAFKNTILGEALVHRAFAYFVLVNMYAKQYDAATSDKDLGVPLQLNPTLLNELRRASVKQVYDLIMADIRRAIPLLPEIAPPAKFQPCKAAAYALLTKVHLNMRNFTDAKAFADSTLALAGPLYDYNTAIALGTFPSQYNESQVILRKIPRQNYSPLQLSESLLTLLGTKDLRYELFSQPGSRFYPAFDGRGFWNRANYAGYPDGPAAGLTTNETWLIKAECLARAGMKDDAVTMLNTLRKLRFRPADYADLSAATPEAALQLVVDERRREFFGSGLRWFDMRRLNKDPQFAKPFVRVFKGVSYTLEPNGNAYVFPLASLNVFQNPELEQNP